MKKLLLLMTVVFIVILAGILLYNPQPKTTAIPESPQPPIASTEVEQVTPGNKTTAQQKLPQMPSYMRDTEVDGVFNVDEAGNLLITDDIRRIFDYFLSTIGEESVEQSLKRLRGYIDNQLQEPAKSQAHEILNQYLQYQQELIALEMEHPQTTDINTLAQREAAVKALRERIFSSEVVAAFFGREQLYNEFTLQRLTILHDPNLSDETKTERIQQLRDALPEEMQDDALTRLLSELNQKSAALQANGGSAADLRKLRQQTVGVEATERLEQLDTKRSEWQNRLLGFQAERQKINDNTGLSDNEKEQAIKRLMEENFSDTERLRIDAALQLYELQQKDKK